jgi:hypothetical protein
METTTIADVRRVFSLLEADAKAAGLLPDGRLHLEEGSATYGRAWRLVWTDREPTKHSGRGAHFRPPRPLEDFLGSTKREAYEALVNMRGQLADRERARREAAELVASLTGSQLQTFRVLLADGGLTIGEAAAAARKL